MARRDVELPRPQKTLTLNGVTLTSAQAIVLRLSLQSFASDLRVEAEESGRRDGQAEHFRDRVRELQAIVYGR